MGINLNSKLSFKMGQNLCKPDMDLYNDCTKPAKIQSKFVKSQCAVTDQALELSYLNQRSTTSIISNDVRNLITSTKKVIKNMSSQKTPGEKVVSYYHESEKTVLNSNTKQDIAENLKVTECQENSNYE